MKHPLLWPLAGAVVAVVGGGTAFAAVEHVPLTTGWYFGLVAGSTVGFGDVVPQDPHGRLVAVLTILLAVPCMGAVFAWLTGHHTAKRLRLHLERAGEDAAAARRIAAATHRHLTGRDHPDAPGGSP